MIGHHHVHDVPRPALRHVAGGAVGRVGRSRSRGPRPLARSGRAARATRAGPMADQTGGADPGHQLRSRQAPVRIVAGPAVELPGARHEAAALPQPVGVMVDLEPLLPAASPAPVVGQIGVHQVSGERLARAVRVLPAAEAAHPGEGDRGLQMALVADVVAERTAEPGRVDDGSADRLPRLGPPRGAAHVLAARPVAALAAEALGEPLRVDLGRSIGVAPGRDLGVAVVAEHALPAHPPEHSLVVRPVVPRGHPPAPLLGIPGDGELVEFALRRPIEIGAGVVAGP